jgi:hypothetical protein
MQNAAPAPAEGVPSILRPTSRNYKWLIHKPALYLDMELKLLVRRKKSHREAGRITQTRLLIKPIDWKGITDRHSDQRAIRGEFGEQIVKEYLEKRGCVLSKQEKRAPGLPDFRIEGTNMFVEVKSHSTKKPPVWQKPFFTMMAKMGWEIFVAHPMLDYKSIPNHVLCRNINWYRFLDNGKLERVDQKMIGF